ncbi:MAG: YkgJ family cysteine cluster protein [Candidatus Bathyarchaeota archaeon]|nr:YkgJ family cysteine cluster protein [Candidatus Bathyarchaeota archaeon]
MHLENVVFPHSVGFHCRSCGVCCRDKPPDINLKEQHRIEAKGFVDFMESPSDPRNRNIRRKQDGSCFFFTEKNTCKIHDVKPAICMLEPFIITGFDPRTKRIFLGLNPLAIKNCKGLSKGEMVAPEEIAETAHAIVEECLEIVASKTGLPVTDMRVASLTSKLLHG